MKFLKLRYFSPLFLMFVVGCNPLQYDAPCVLEFEVVPATLDGVVAYVFADDVLQHKCDWMSASDGLVQLSYSGDFDNRVVLVAGVADSDLPTVEVGATTREEFDAMRFGAHSAYGADGFYGADVSYNALSRGGASVVMGRRTSRVDLSVQGGRVVSATFQGLMTSGTLVDASVATTTGQVAYSPVVPIDGTKKAVCYLYAGHYTSQASVTIEFLTTDGVAKTHQISLPLETLAGQIYTLNIDESAAEITTREWAETLADTDNSEYDYLTQIVVDSVLSEGLPAGVSVEEDGAVVVVPYSAQTFEITIKSDVEVELFGADRCSVSEVGPNRFELTTKRMPIAQNSDSLKMNLYLRRKNLTTTYNEYITVRQAPNPVTVSGPLADYIDAESNFLADCFVDNDILEFTLPDGYTLSVQSDVEWLRVDPQNPTVLQGGYRPNDAAGNGEVETGEVSITDPTGTTEKYRVQRINEGIPVVLFNGNYWSKFNMRGNPSRAGDQVQISDPLVAETDLYTYLKTCSYDDFCKVAGDGYLASNLTPLSYDLDSLDFTDYSDFSTLSAINHQPAAHSCPPGYERPTWSDLGTIFMSGTMTLTLTSLGDELYENTSSAYNTSSTPTYRNLVAAYAGIHGNFDAFKLTANVATNQSEPLVWTGRGAKWSATSYSSHLSLYPAYDTSNENMVRLMFTSSTLAYTSVAFSQNTLGVYHVRCVKGPVAFEY